MLDAPHETLAAGGAAEQHTHLLARVGGYTVAIPIGVVISIHEAPLVFPVPCAQPGIAGAIRFSGIAIPVFDLRRSLRLEPRNIVASDRLVLIDAGVRIMALIVDDVLEFVSIDRNHRRRFERLVRRHAGEREDHRRYCLRPELSPSSTRPVCSCRTYGMPKRCKASTKTSWTARIHCSRRPQRWPRSPRLPQRSVSRQPSSRSPDSASPLPCPRWSSSSTKHRTPRSRSGRTSPCRSSTAEERRSCCSTLGRSSA